MKKLYKLAGFTIMLTLAGIALAQSPSPGSFTRIESGNFTMGSPAREVQRHDNEGPQREVTVSAFYMAKNLVTQKEYEELMGSNPSKFKAPGLPVERVTWFDAIEFCNKLSEQEGLTPAYTISGTGRSRTVIWNQNTNGYRLPTEAEWEYACRAGTTTPFSTGNNITTSQANYDGQSPYSNYSRGEYREETTVAGSFPANPWGLHDMHGNVFEWCWDWYGNYTSDPQTNPKGEASGSYRVLRGGSWYDNGRYIRSAYRNSSSPFLRSHSVGFRLARSWDNPGVTGAILEVEHDKESVFLATHITTDNLRLREDQNLSSPTITILEKGTKTLIKEWGNIVTVDGKSAQWAYIYTIDGFEGWCYSGYLEEIE